MMNVYIGQMKYTRNTFSKYQNLQMVWSSSFSSCVMKKISHLD
jgi:hypothetical protein